MKFFRCCLPRFVFLFFSISLYFWAKPYEAFVIVPVVDILSRSCDGTAQERVKFYNNLPLSPVESSAYWPRIHQALFNETVWVIKEENGQAFVEMKNCFILDEHYNKKEVQGWVQLDDVYATERAIKNRVQYGFPAPIDYRKSAQIVRPTLVIYEPWFEDQTQQIYSAGTRFIRAPQDDSEDFYAINLFDKSRHKLLKAFIGKRIAIIEEERSQQQQQDLFLKILDTWCSYQLPIAYVFGGSSFCKLTSAQAFLAPYCFGGKSFSCWNSAEYDQKVMSGLDCSGLLLRAAQIAGMPYYFKNSLSILRGLKQLGEEKSLSVGDLVWTKGHVGIVSALISPQFIEAAGYGRGYGKVHKIELKKRFLGAANWHDLLFSCFNHTVPTNINADGSLSQDNMPLVFLRLATLWDNGDVL